MDPNEFLSLLVDNLKYQDPLDPTSSADLLTQLAALSQVQTQQQIAETDQTSAAANLIGDTITGSAASGSPITGVVTGFSLTTSGPTLDVGDSSVSLGNISAVEHSRRPRQHRCPARPVERPAETYRIKQTDRKGMTTCPSYHLPLPTRVSARCRPRSTP